MAMRVIALCCAATFFVMGGAQVTQAQVNDEQLQTLRKQREALQEQIKKLEDADRPNRAVTQIGTSRRPGSRELGMIVRIYDLSDLFAVAPPYEARHFGDLNGQSAPLFPMPAMAGRQGAGGMSGGMGGGGGGFFALPDKPKSIPVGTDPVLKQVNTASEAVSARTSLQDLVQAITTTINPEGWDEVGGAGSIATLGNSLLISTDEATHEQIGALMDLFRQRWGTLRTVSVRAYWLWLNDEQLGDLVSEAGPAKGDEIQAYGTVDDTAWKRLMEAQRVAGDDLPGGYRAVLTCYNGQTVNTASGGQSLAITDLKPTAVAGPKEDSQLGYQPTMIAIQEGAVLQITPVVNTSGKYVVLDIHSRVTKLMHREETPPAAGEAKDATRLIRPQDVVAALDRPYLKTHQLATTLRVPTGHTMLVGGMTFENEPAPSEPSLYLFVRVSVQELRDDKPATKPDADAAKRPGPEGAKSSKEPVK